MIRISLVVLLVLVALVAALVRDRTPRATPVGHVQLVTSEHSNQDFFPPHQSVLDPPLNPGPGDCILSVVSESGMAIRAATVRGAFDQIVLGSSDGSGKVIVPRIKAPGFLSEWDKPVLVTHPEYAACALRIAYGQAEARVVLTAGSRLVAFVMGEDDRPIEGASIEAIRQTHERPIVLASGVTDAEGSAALKGLPPGLLRFKIRAPGFALLEGDFMISPQQSREERFRLLRGAILDVKVKDSRGALVQGAEVRVKLDENDHNKSSMRHFSIPWKPRSGPRLADKAQKEHTWSGHTDSAGCATFSEIPPDARFLCITVSHPDFASVDESSFSSTGRRHDEVVVTLPPCATVKVTVLDEAGESPHGRVTLQEENSPYWSHSLAYEGEPVKFQGVPTEKSLIAVFSQNCYRLAITRLTVEENQVTETLIRAPRSVGSSFRARDSEGRDVPGRLDLKSLDGFTEAVLDKVRYPSELRYWLTIPAEGAPADVRQGNYEFMFLSASGGRVQGTMMILGGESHIIDVPFTDSFHGRVVDQAGKPMAGFEIEWIDEGGLFETFTDGEGRFRLAKVKGGEGRLTLTNELLADETLFEGSAGGGMELLARVNRGTLRGRVLDEAGKSVPGIVSVTMKSLGDLSTQESVRLNTLYPAVGADGRFEILLPLGSWTLQADDGARMSQSEVFEIGSGVTEAHLRLSDPIKSGD